MTGWNSTHHRFLDLARHVAGWSKDPSTQTGCAIIRPDHTVASVGYNGFPRGVSDGYNRLMDRPTKYAMTVHAEVNAILSSHGRLDGCTLYCYPWPPCSNCAGAIIQAGIIHVVSVEPTEEQRERWGDSFKHMEVMFREAGVRLDTIPSRWLD